MPAVLPVPLVRDGPVEPARDAEGIRIGGRDDPVAARRRTEVLAAAEEGRPGVRNLPRAGLRARVSQQPAPGDDLPVLLGDARAKLEELETRTRLDEKKIDRLERKNRELVRANLAAEMAQKRG